MTKEVTNKYFLEFKVTSKELSIKDQVVFTGLKHKFLEDTCNSSID